MLHIKKYQFERTPVLLMDSAHTVGTLELHDTIKSFNKTLSMNERAL
jgi:hypothetical protein